MVNVDLATQLRVAVMPCRSGHVTVIIRQCLLLSGDVELNPGPLDQGRLLLLLYEALQDQSTTMPITVHMAL